MKVLTEAMIDRIVGFFAWLSVQYPMCFAFPPGPVTDPKIQELQNELVDLSQRAQVVQASADAENRVLSEDEEKEVDSIFGRFEEVKANIERRTLILAQSAEINAPQGRQTDPEPPDPQNQSNDDGSPPPQRRVRPQARSRTPITMPEDRGKWGWKNMGEFAQAAKHGSSRSNPVFDPRLVVNAPTSVSSEGIGDDGGFLVPPDFRQEIWQKVSGEDSFLPLTDQQVCSRNTMTFPADETTPWDTTTGVQAYFESEAGQISQSKIAIQDRTIKLNKLTALVPVTEELMEDAPALDSYLRSKVSTKFDFKLKLKMLQGTGAGEPLGCLNAASLVSVTKETGQDADTIVADNINKMWSRMYAPCRRNAVWLINQDIEPQLDKLSVVIGVGGVPIYLPAGGIADTPYARLKGRPVIPTQATETLGDKGDIILVSWSEYLTVTKTGGLRTDVSMHLFFDFDVAAFRFILRIAGMPHWKTYITPRDGSNYLSWAVTLDERS